MPEDVTELQQSNKTGADEELLLLDEHKKWFLVMESIWEGEGRGKGGTHVIRRRGSLT